MVSRKLQKANDLAICSRPTPSGRRIVLIGEPPREDKVHASLNSAGCKGSVQAGFRVETETAIPVGNVAEREDCSQFWRQRASHFEVRTSKSLTGQSPTSIVPENNFRMRRQKTSAWGGGMALANPMACIDAAARFVRRAPARVNSRRAPVARRTNRSGQPVCGWPGRVHSIFVVGDRLPRSYGREIEAKAHAKAVCRQAPPGSELSASRVSLARQGEAGPNFIVKEKHRRSR